VAIGNNHGVARIVRKFIEDNGAMRAFMDNERL
jgi:hypothetical protein